jgi:hypothetical protein
MRINDDGRTVAAMDVLAPGIGEIIGGSQREERLDVLDRNMAERGIDKEHYAWYCDLSRYGTVPPPPPNPPPQAGEGGVGVSVSSAPFPTSPGIASPLRKICRLPRSVDPSGQLVIPVQSP